jgi:chromosome segregation ATPase
MKGQMNPNDTPRDGNWMDKWGACKVCDGEIPDGHLDHCDIYKMELKIRTLETELNAAKQEVERLNKAVIETAQQVDAQSNLICNIQDTCRSRGFAQRPVDEAVIAIAQERDSLRQQLEESHHQLERVTQDWHARLKSHQRQLKDEKAYSQQLKEGNSACDAANVQLRQQLEAKTKECEHFRQEWALATIPTTVDAVEREEWRQERTQLRLSNERMAEALKQLLEYIDTMHWARQDEWCKRSVESCKQALSTRTSTDTWKCVVKMYEALNTLHPLCKPAREEWMNADGYDNYFKAWVAAQEALTLARSLGIGKDA